MKLKQNAKFSDALTLTIFFFAGVAILYLMPVRLAGDSRFALLTAQSFLDGHWGDLQSYTFFMDYANSGNAARETERGLFYYFPIGPSVYAIPGLWVASLIDPEISYYARISALSNLQSLMASAFVMGSAVYLYLAGLKLKLNRNHVLIAVFLYVFASTNASQVSRALWSHAPYVFFLSGAIYYFIKSVMEDRKGRLENVLGGTKGEFGLGLCLAMAFTCRPIAVIPILILGAVLLLRNRRVPLTFLFGASFIAVPWLAFNIYAFGGIFPPYYSGGRVGREGGFFFEALFGNLISPSRGLLIYMPWVVGVMAFIVPVMRPFRAQRFLNSDTDDRPYQFAALSILIIVLHLILISTFPHWWAGHSFGPRFMVDVLPFFVVLVFLIIQRLPVMRERPNPVVLLLLFAVWFSILVNMRGSWDRDVHIWNARPVSVDKDPSRLWDWKNAQFSAELGWSNPTILGLTGRSPRHFRTRITATCNAQSERELDVALSSAKQFLSSGSHAVVPTQFEPECLPADITLALEAATRADLPAGLEWALSSSAQSGELYYVLQPEAKLPSWPNSPG